MAASVQELLLAANAKKSPFINMMEGAAQGFQQGRTGALDRELKMVNIARQKQSLEFDRMLRAAYEQAIDRGLNKVEVDEGGVLPEQKYETSFGMNKGGPWVKTAPAGRMRNPNKQAKEYRDPKNGKTRIGTFNPETGMEMSDKDPYAPEKAAGAARGGMSTGQMALQNKRAYDQAVKWYVQQFPEKGTFDLATGKVLDNKITEGDTQTGEFVGLFERAKSMLLKGIEKEGPLEDADPLGLKDFLKR